MQLRVMTFNLRQNNARDKENAWPHRKDLVADVLTRVKPAVVGVQEGFYEMLTELAALAPEFDWIGEGRRGGVQDEFSAILYRPALLQPVTAGRFWLSHRPDVPGSQVPETGIPRMCTWVRFRERESGQEVLIYNTHLDHRSQAAREIGADLILEHIRSQWRYAPLPTLLTGDMNATPENSAIATFKKVGADGAPGLFDAYAATRERGEDVGATFHGFSGETEGAPIDYIFHSHHWRVHEIHVESQAVGGRYPSDHYPVWGVFGC